MAKTTKKKLEEPLESEEAAVEEIKLAENS